ncbi:MAG: inositol monophosphatase [Nitrospirae bacterium]|nr:inositol monophosphatase [Nitrospirota bacterium]
MRTPPPRTLSVDDSNIARVASATAKEAGALLRGSYGRALNVRFKGRRNLVTDLDHRAQALILRRVGAAFPDHVVVAEEEENPMAGSREAECQWFVDPLDGTTNYAHSYPRFCVSIAFAYRGKIQVGVVFDPMAGEMFSAVKGKGAFLNGRRIHVSTASKLERSLVCTGFSYNRRWALRNLECWKRFLLKAQAIRRDGSAALDLCYTACGRFDGFWELRLSPWDVAAGALIVTEAGGRVTGLRGEPFDPYAKNILSSNGRIHTAMQRLLRPR